VTGVNLVRGFESLPLRCGSERGLLYAGASAATSARIGNGEFFTAGATGAWTGAAAGTFHGTFDSPTTAHGTARMSAFVGGPGCFLSGTSNTGTFSWTAAREG
jgi:hypothetical protein